MDILFIITFILTGFTATAFGAIFGIVAVSMYVSSEVNHIRRRSKRHKRSESIEES